MSIKVTFVLVFLLFGCSSTALTVDELLANKEIHQNQNVRVSGVFHIEFEGNELRGEKNKLWLSLYKGPPWTKESIESDEERIKKLKELYQDKEVVLEGVFTYGKKGHFGLWPAEIDDIKNVQFK